MKKENIEQVIPNYNYVYVSMTAHSVIAGMPFTPQRRADGYFEVEVKAVGKLDTEKYEFKTGDKILLDFDPFDKGKENTVVSVTHIAAKLV